MKVPYINLIEEHRQLREELLTAINGVFDNAQFILGDEVSLFERNFSDFINAKYAVALNSGTDALYLALKVLGIGDGDEVITVPNSFLATASAIMACNARPVFVDVRDDFNIDPDLIEDAVTEKTKAILPVHLTGKPADMYPLLELADKYNLHIIEDCAQAVGAEYSEKKVGTFGISGCFSLHPLKNLSACGDGGIIVTENEEIYQKLLALRNIGLKNRDECDLWGINSRLDTLQAAVLNVKFKYLDSWTEKRRNNARFYRDNLRDSVIVPEEKECEKPVYHTFIVRAEKRDELKRFLSKNGIETKIHYPIPIHVQKAAEELGYKQGDFPVTEEHVRTMLTLPVHQYLTDEQKHYVVSTIKSFYGR